ncbi:MAG: NAD(P)-dependent alcohol dehydrogenase [Pseudomonadota bacterium]
MSHNTHMTAVMVDRYGPPQVLSLHRVPVPSPAPGEVLVRVHASTVGRTDTATLRAHPFFARLATGLLRPNMHTLGMDFAGVVEAVGQGVTTLSPGHRVFGMSPDRFGAHAEYLCTPAAGAIALIPNDSPLDQAIVGEGAWYAHGTTRQLSEGDRCLIYGASGAIGTAAVQLAKARGAYVVAVVGARHVALARRLGADRVVNYQVDDFTAIGETFDLVFDAVGKTSWFACRKLLVDGGVFSATDLGPGWSNILLGAWSTITGSKRVQVPFPENAPDFIRYLADLMATGQFHGVFDRSYTLEQIVDAFRYVETEQKTGIVVINIP